MNRKRLGQVLIGGVFAASAAVIAALVELVASERKQSLETNLKRTVSQPDRKHKDSRVSDGEIARFAQAIPERKD